MLRIVISIIVISLTTLCNASEYNKATTLCTKNEKELLNCSSGAKIASICASNDATRSSGYAQYRFGTPSEIELEFPKEKTIPSSSFVIHSIPRPGGSDTTITFTNNEYTYRIKDVSGHPYGEDIGFESSTKIYVNKGNSQIGEITCKNYDSGLKSEAYEIFKQEN